NFGGAILGPEAGKLTLTHVLFQQNSATSGGAIYAWQIEGSDIQLVTNTATNNVGGILAAGDGASVTLESASFEDNAGGCLAAPEASLTDTVFRNNDSGARPTAIFENATLTRVTFDGNTTSQTGAAFAFPAASAGSPTVHLVDSEVVNNTSGYGGAIYLNGQTASDETHATLVVDNTSFGTAKDGDDNVPSDVYLHDVGVDN